MRNRNWIFKGFTILLILVVLIQVIQAQGKSGDKGKGKGKGKDKKRGKERSYDNVLCYPDRLKEELGGDAGTKKVESAPKVAGNDTELSGNATEASGNKTEPAKESKKTEDQGKKKGHDKDKGKGKAKGKGKSKKDVLAKILKQWDAITAEDKKKINDSFTAETLKDLAAPILAKVPVACLDRLNLTGITDAQVVELAKTERSLESTIAGAELVADKAAFLTKALAATTLGNRYKMRLAMIIGSVELKKKIANLDCSYLTGALLDPAILKADITAFDAKFTEKKCRWPDKRCIAKTIAVRIKQASLKDNIEDCGQYLKPVLSELKPKECKKLFDKKKLEAAKATFLDKIKDAVFSKKSQCGRHIMKYMSKCTWLDETKFPLLGTLIQFFPMKVLKSKDCQKFPIYMTLKYGIPAKMKCYECAKKDPIAKIDWAKIADAAKLKSEVKGYLPFVPTSKLSLIPAAKQSLMCAADVKSLYVDVLPYGSSGSSRFISKACKIGAYTDVSTYAPADCTNAAKMKGLAESRDSFAVDTAVAKLKTPDCVMVLFKNPRLAARIPCKVITKAVIDKLVTADDAISASITSSKACCILAAIKKTAKVDTWTAGDLAKYAPLVARAFNKQDYDSLKKLTDSAKWSQLCTADVAPTLRQSVRKYIVGQLMDSLRIENEEDPVSVLSDSEADLYSGCLGELPQENIASASPEVQKGFCEKKGAEALTSCFKRVAATRAKVVTMCINAVKGDQPLTAEGARILGDFACDLSKTVVEKMDDAEFSTALQTFGQCRNIRKETRDAILTKAKGANVLGDPSTWTSESISCLGQLAWYTVKADAEKIADFGTMIGGIVGIPKPSFTCLDRMTGSKTAADELRKARKTLFGVLLAKLRASKRRRKRATTVKTFDCATIELLPASAISDFTVDEIKAIPAAEFKNCYNALGKAEWDATKCAELYKRVKADVASNDMCAASDQVLTDAKNILLCMPDADIDCQKWDSDAKTQALGGLAGWSDAQLTKLGASYKKAKAAGYKPGEFTATTIKALDRVLCGLPPADLLTINPANFKTALPQQNSEKIYDKCPKDPVLKNLLEVCKKPAAYGPIKDWTSTTTTEVGVLLSAASPEDVKALGKNIENVPSSAMENMDKEALKAVSPEFAADLPTELQTSLGIGPEAKKAEDATKDASGAGFIKVEQFLIISTVTIVCWFTGKF